MSLEVKAPLGGPLSVGETDFFRDVLPFEALRRRILPELLAARAPERQLNIWSAACAGGQEAYSVALALREQCSEIDDWQLRLLASDVDERLLDRAREGWYSQPEVSRGLPPQLLVQYFFQHGIGWKLVKSIRRMVEFFPLDLADTWPSLPPMDLILLRNILPHVDPQTHGYILHRVQHYLRPGGYLMLGQGEVDVPLGEAWEAVETDCFGWFRLRAGGVSGRPEAVLTSAQERNDG